MADLATNTMKMEVQLSTTGIPEATEQFRNFTESLNQMTGKARKAQEALAMERLSVEGQYSPEAQRELELKKLIQLQDRLNMSTETYRQMKREIAERYNVAIATAGPSQDQHIIDYRNAQVEEQRINNARIADRERAAKEIKRIEDSQLTEFQRAQAKIQSIKDQYKAGIIDRTQARYLADYVNHEYTEHVKLEQKKLKAKQDALDKQVAAEKASSDKSYRAWADDNDRRIEGMKKRFITDPANAAIDARQLKAKLAIEATEAADKAANAERQRAVALMNSYASVADRAAADTLQFNAALAAGTITADEHARAIAGVDARMRSMAGGAGNMDYVVGNVMTGLEDFTTVLSITGFGMDGFAAATRSASNNVGQAVRGMGTASAAMLAPMVSIGMVLVGFAIPAIYKWASGQDDAAEATKRHKEAIDSLIRSATYWSSIQLRDFNRRMTSNDIDSMTEVSEMDKMITDTLNKMSELDIKIGGTTAGLKTEAAEIFESIVNPNDDFNKLVNAFGKIAGSDVEVEFRNRMEGIKKAFVDNIVTGLDPEKARQNLEAGMRKLVKDMGERPDWEEAASKAAEGQMTVFNDFQNQFFDSMNDAAVIDRIEAAQDRIAELSTDSSEAARKEREELESLTMALDEMLDKRQELLKFQEKWTRDADNSFFDDELANDLEILRIQSMKNRLLGEENEAERKLLDLSQRRKEIMESGLAAPDVLEGMFNAELEAIAADIENKLSKLQQITPQTDMQNQAQAYVSANKQILEAAKDKKEEEKEMVQLLEAIEKHLSGTDLINMQVI